MEALQKKGRPAMMCIPMWVDACSSVGLSPVVCGQAANGNSNSQFNKLMK